MFVKNGKNLSQYSRYCVEHDDLTSQFKKFLSLRECVCQSEPISKLLYQFSCLWLFLKCLLFHCILLLNFIQQYFLRWACICYVKGVFLFVCTFIVVENHKTCLSSKRYHGAFSSKSVKYGLYFVLLHGMHFSWLRSSYLSFRHVIGFSSFTHTFSGLWMTTAIQK